MIDTQELTIATALDRLADGAFSARELAESYLVTAKEKNTNVNAYLEYYDDALHMADAVAERIKAGETLPLAGIPLAIKDNILILGKRASAGSKILESYTATYDATVIRRLREAGAVFLGRANMDEFAMGSSTETSAYGITKNPLDTTRVPGGSSGGSAAAVAMGGALAALGSDTGGSIRQPAAFVGLVGLKPTYGAVSRSGLMALASSLDQIGPITKTVADAEIFFRVISGSDPKDGTTAQESDTLSRKPMNGAKRLGVPEHLLEERGIDDDVRDNFRAMASLLQKDGFTLVPIELPHIAYSLPTYYIIMPAEASSNLARYDGIRYGLSIGGETLLDTYVNTRTDGFGAEVRRRVLLGTSVLSTGYYDAYYKKATDVRALIRDDFAIAFENVDAIITPTTPTPAFKIGEKARDPLAMYYSDVLTVPANLSGIPALSVPSGTVMRDGSALPVGFQIMAPHFREDILFTVGRAVERLARTGEHYV